MRMNLSIFHDKSVFMGEMADFFFFFEAESFITQISPTFFFASSSCFFLLSFLQVRSLMYSHHFLCSAQPLAYFYSCPKALWNWSIQEVDRFFRQRLVGIHRLNFIFLMLHIRPQRTRGIQEGGGGGVGGGERGGERDGWDAQLSATL